MSGRITILAAVCAALSGVVFAEGEVYEGYWESSSNGVGAYWWNAASWRDGIIPGYYAGKDSEGNIFTNGNRGATAYLGTKSWDYLNPETFDSGWSACKLISISNLVFTADHFPKIGQSQWFNLYLEQGGGVYVRDTCTKAPTFGCKVCFDAIDDGRPLTFQNDAAGTTMQFNYAFGLRKIASGYYLPPMRYGGKGSVSLAGAQPGYNNCRFYTDLFFTAPGRLELTGTFEQTLAVRTLAGFGPQEVNIAEGAACYIDAGGIYADQIIARTDLAFTGAGTLKQKSVGSTPFDIRLRVEDGCTLTIGTPFENGWPEMGWILNGTAGGILKITGSNLMQGAAGITGGAIFEAQALGMAGEASPLGLGSQINLSGSGILRYTGTGETTDRTIGVSGTGILDQAGTGTPEFAGALVGASTATLVLSNGTAVAARYSGALTSDTGAPKIRKVGSGEWIIDADVAEAGEIEISSGTLTIENPAMTVAKITVAAGATLALGGDTAPATQPSSLTVYGTGQIMAKWPTALPANGIVTPDGATLAAMLPPWTWAEALAWANANTLDSWSPLMFDMSNLADGTTYALAHADVTGDAFALGRQGDTTLGVNVTDAIAKSVSLVSREGTFRLTGAGSLALGKVLATSDASGGTFGTIAFDNLALGATIGDDDVIAGSATTATAGGVGTIAVTNTNVSCSEGKAGTIKIGQYGKGLLKVDGASTVEATLSAGTGESKSQTTGEGTVWQTDGTVLATNGVALGGYGTGAYRISGGKLVSTQNSRFFGGSSGQGIFRQTGGEVEIVPIDWAVFFGYNGAFVGYQTGGKLTVRNKRAYFSKGETAHSSYYTVAGSNAVTEIEQTFYMGEGHRKNDDGPLKAILNLNDGGTFTSAGVGYYPTSTSEWKRAYVNFNGGKLVTTVVSPLGGTPGSYPTRPDRATIFAKGAEISIPAGWNGTLPIALSAPYGDSVLAVPIPDALADRTFGAPPHVEIFDEEGSGDGASAFAEVDPATWKLTKIVVTSPGWGYTKAVARFSVGPLALATGTCTLGPAASGGFVKSGAGGLTFLATNTYAGATVVREGTLKLGIPGSLPTNGTVRVEKAGTLDLNGMDTPVAALDVEDGGAVTGGTVILPGLTYDFAHPETAVWNGAVTFSAGAKVTLKNVDAADPKVRSYVLARFTGTVAHAPTEIEGPEEAWIAKWHVTVGAQTIRLMRTTGITINMR